jgi:hypothetical protein
MRCHVSCSFVPHLPVEVGSGVATCPAAPDLASLLRWAPVSPRVPQLRTSPPCWSELQQCHVPHSLGPCLLTEVNSSAVTCSTVQGSAFLRGGLRDCHVSHSPRRTVDHRNKKRLIYPRHAGRLACFQGTLVRYWSVCKRAGHYSASL